MCGIAGRFNFDPARPVDPQILAGMTEAIAHRVGILDARDRRRHRFEVERRLRLEDVEPLFDRLVAFAYQRRGAKHD